MTLPAATDWNLIVRGCIDGDRLAWETLVSASRPMIIGVLHRRIGDVEIARDLAQDVFLRLVENGCRRLRAFDPERNVPLLSYLRVIAVNLSIDWSRGRHAKARGRTIALEELVDRLVEPPCVEKLLAAGAVHDAVEELPDRERLAVRLMLDGLKTKEIARIMGLSDGGVSALHFRARRKLATLLEGGWADPGSAGGDARPAHRGANSEHTKNRSAGGASE